MTTYDKIKIAIQNKQVIAAFYDGEMVELCPYILGTKDDIIKLLFYQIEKLPLANHWRCINIEKLENIEFVDTPWEFAKIPENYTPCVSSIDSMLHFDVDL